VQLPRCIGQRHRQARLQIGSRGTTLAAHHHDVVAQPQYRPQQRSGFGTPMNNGRSARRSASAPSAFRLTNAAPIPFLDSMQGVVVEPARQAASNSESAAASKSSSRAAIDADLELWRRRRQHQDDTKARDRPRQ